MHVLLQKRILCGINKLTPNLSDIDVVAWPLASHPDTQAYPK